MQLFPIMLWQRAIAFGRLRGRRDVEVQEAVVAKMPDCDGLRRKPQKSDGATIGQEGGFHTPTGEQRLVKVFRIDLPDIVETGVEPRSVRMPDRDGLGADEGVQIARDAGMRSEGLAECVRAALAK